MAKLFTSTTATLLLAILVGVGGCVAAFFADNVFSQCCYLAAAILSVFYVIVLIRKDKGANHG